MENKGVSMNINIKCRYSDKILFEGELSSTREAVIEAFKKSVNLRGADLEGADLEGADLWGVNLRGVNLRGADLRGEKLAIAPVFIYGFRPYNIMITNQNIKIGCKVHKWQEWRDFKNREILELDGKRASVFWKRYKTVILEAAKEHRSEVRKYKNDNY